jgi:hypothetical protein
LSAKAILEGDEEPPLVTAETIVFAVSVIVIALGLSITTNTYHDLHSETSIPWTIPLAFGIAIPVLIAIISHTAATFNVDWKIRAALATPVAAFMAYSANAGITVLGPVMGTFWAAVVTITVDVTAIVYLGVLVFASEMKRQHAAWEKREARRLQQAESEKIMARYSRDAARVTGQGNAGGNAPGNTGGNATAAIAGDAPLPAITAGSPPAGGVTGPDGNPEGEGTGPANVTQLRRPAQSAEELLTAAATMAADLAKIGDLITGRGYRAQFGGKPDRVGPVVNDVKDALARLGGQATAEEIITEVRAARSKAGQGTPVSAGAR